MTSFPSMSLRSWVWLLIGAAASAVTLAPSPAAACGACACPVPWGVRPGNLRDDAPRNVRFLVALDVDPAQISWTDADGAAVAFDIVPTEGSGNEVWLVPSEALAADSDFSLRVAGGDSWLFHTGSTVDLTPPEATAPTATPIEGPNSACGAFSGARLEWEEIRDDHDPVTYDPVVRLDVQQGEDSIVLYTAASDLFPGRSVELATPSSDESSACWGHLALPFGSAGDTLTVTPTIYDAAGNPLVGDPIEVTLGDSPGASCPDGDPSAERGGGNCAVSRPDGGAGRSAGWLLSLGAVLCARTLRKRGTRGELRRVRAGAGT